MAAPAPQQAAPPADMTLPLPVPIPANEASDPAARAAAAAQIDQTLKLYRETMTYPLSSRPADGSNAHITRWNHPIRTGQPFAVDAEKREIEAIAEIDRIFAAPGQAIAVTLAVRYVADQRPTTAEEIGAELQWHDRDANEWVTIQPIELRKTGDRWTGSVVPSQVEALRKVIREARIMAYARTGEFARELTLDFLYAVAQPVVVHGLAFDRVVHGSLELGLDVELAAVAPVRMMATLFAADGTTAIGVFDDRYFPKRAGRQVIPVQFFGKILHDRGIDGPYRLGAVHGYVYRADLSPDELHFDRADQPPITTVAHRAAAFSPDAYQSPEVAARIAHYEAVREAMRAGREPPPPPQ